MARTLLRYPGGKSRAVKHLLPFVPQGTKEMAAPFFGGGALELACVERGIRVHGYDSFMPVVYFWQAVVENPNLLAEVVRVQHPLGDKKRFKYFQQVLSKACEENEPFSYRLAAIFFILNRCSFSGTTLSGGMSSEAAARRFTVSSIDRIRDFPLKNFAVQKADFKDSIPCHGDMFLYCDPPYMLKKERNNLYGDKGDAHRGFDHLALHGLLAARNNWMLSYNNCPEILELYKDYEIYYPDWSYGMSQDKDSKEVLIIAK
jgi:DNA adenine methylase